MRANHPFDAGQRFEIRRSLGSGGMGVVYEAYDRELEQAVALKTLQRADSQLLSRLKQEFRALHDLSHPNLVGLGELFDGDDGPFFTMELVRGVDFLGYVRAPVDEAGGAPAIRPTATTSRQGLADERAALAEAPHLGAPTSAPPTPSRPAGDAAPAYDEVRLRAALKQLAGGIAALHDAGKVHRDIKPSNIMVEDDGRVVLLDFGLVAEVASPRESTGGRVVGTVAYMAPEQALGGDVTPAADWYSLGVVLFEALTGSLPHTGRTPYELIIRKHQYMAAPPRQYTPAVPPDLDALCSALLRTQPDDRPRARDIFDRLGVATRREASLDRASAGPSLPSAMPFVGRTEQLAALRAAYDTVHDGPLVCLVEGVSGVGKTQLVERFLDELASDQPDTVVLAGRCYEREMVAFKAFDGIADALTRHLARLPATQAAELMPLRPALLARLFPVLKRVEIIARSPIVPDVPDPHDQRRRMFASLRELFQRLSDRHRLVWYIDDLQWTDADSLTLLADLIAHEEPLPVFIVATMRPVDTAPRAALLAKLEELAPTTRLQLGELTPGEARQLAERLLPDSDATTLEAVATDAGGHPLLLHELARHTGIGHETSARGVTLEEMLAARIGQLDSHARALLDVVGVSGGPLSQDVATVAAELSNAEQVKAAAVLRAAHLVRTDGVRRTDRIVVYHDRVREHVYAQLDEARRSELHERLAVALEQTGAAAHDPRALVWHARAAGRRSLAATYARTAGGHAIAALAFDQAAELFAEALDLGTYDEATLRDLRIELATALMHAGRGPEAAETFMLAAEGAEPAVRLDCQRQAADQWIITGHLERGMAALEASLADIHEPPAASPRRALARVLWNRARLRLRGTTYTRRLESQIPIETLRRLDVLRAVAHGLAMVDNIRGADFNGRYLLLALRTGEPRRLLGAMAAEIIFLASQGGRAERRAWKLYDQLVGLADECPDRAYARTWVLLADGAARFFDGRFRSAVESLERTEEIFAEGLEGLTYEKNNARVFRVHALRMLGAVRRHGALIGELLRTGRQRGDLYLETTLELLHCQSRVAHGDVIGARRGIEEATWTPLEHGYHLQHWYELLARSELALYEQQATTALEALASSFAALQRSMLLRVKLVRIDAAGLRGRLLVAAAAARPLPECVVEARAIARALERERTGYASVFAALLRAGLASIASHDDATVDQLRRAVELAAEHDMTLHLAAARDRLGAILGGDEGATLRAAAARYVADEQLVAPDALFALVAPGVRG